MTDPRTGSRWILGDKFEQVYPHLGSIDNLWNKKWKFPCERSLYPFHDGKYEDFAPIFETLIQKGIHDGYSVEYTAEFLPTCEDLVKRADVMASTDKKAAIELYLRACAVYRIARFPYINSDPKREAYEAQKRAYMKAAALFDVPITDVVIPHTAGQSNDEGKEIPLYVRVPKGSSKDKPAPAVILMCGLDGHRPDNTVRSDEFLNRGWASVIVDIPGTADCPADRRDATSPDRLWTSILDWMEKEGYFDMRKVLAVRIDLQCRLLRTLANKHISSGASPPAATTLSVLRTLTQRAFWALSVKAPVLITFSPATGWKRRKTMSIHGPLYQLCAKSSATRPRMSSSTRRKRTSPSSNWEW